MDLSGLTRVLAPRTTDDAGRDRDAGAVVPAPNDLAVRELAGLAARAERDGLRLRLNGNDPVYVVEDSAPGAGGVPEVRLALRGRRYVLVADPRGRGINLLYEQPSGKRSLVCRVESIDPPATT